jgi:hypothetical protein
MFQERGVFCQLSVPGRPGMDNVVCPKASAEASHIKSPGVLIYFTIRDFMFFSPEATENDDILGRSYFTLDMFSCRITSQIGSSGPSSPNSDNFRVPRNPGEIQEQSWIVYRVFHKYPEDVPDSCEMRQQAGAQELCGSRWHS